MIIRWLIVIFWSVLLFLILISTTKENIVTNNHYVIRNINCLFPEGWGFFTRDPTTEKEVYIYSFNSNGTLTKLDFCNQSFSNLLGFSRNSRLKMYDLSNILNQLNDDKFWISVKGDIDNINSLKKIPVQKGQKIKLLPEGIYILQVKEKIPYVWANKGQEKFVKSKVAKIYLYE